MEIKKVSQILEEGTWAISKGRHKRVEAGKNFIVKIEKLKREISSVFGDDQLFDEFDGAVARIEELMELPEDQIKESKEKIPTLDDEEIFEFGLKMKHIRKIIVLLFGDMGINMDDKKILKSIQISVIGVPSSYNGKGGKYIYVSSTSFDWEIKIWEDGYVALENGLDNQIRYTCAKEIYSIISKNIK